MSAVPAPDPSMFTTPDKPGLYVYAPVDPDRPWGRLAATPRASFACRCGLQRRGTGPEQVKQIVALHLEHPDTCPLETDQRSTA